MSSIRFWLFGFFPLAAAVSLLAMDVRKSFVTTTDWRDLAVDGCGYIETRDDEGLNPIWFRSVRMGVNQHGWLSAHIGGALRPIEPPIPIPSGWTRINIDTKGEVTFASSGSSGVTIGLISLTTFAGDDVNESNRIENAEDRMGPPIVAEPGSDGAGYLKQYAAIQYSLPVNAKFVIAFSFVIVWLALGITTNRRVSNPRSQSATP